MSQREKFSTRFDRRRFLKPATTAGVTFTKPSLQGRALPARHKPTYGWAARQPFLNCSYLWYNCYT